MPHVVHDHHEEAGQGRSYHPVKVFVEVVRIPVEVRDVNKVDLELGQSGQHDAGDGHQVGGQVCQRLVLEVLQPGRFGCRAGGGSGGGGRPLALVNLFNGLNA